MNNQIVQPEVTPPQQAIFSQPKSRLPLVLLGLFSLILVGVVSFHFGQRSQLTNNQVIPTPSLIPTVSIQPSPTPDATANWPIYSNTYYNFDFQYPPNWEGPLKVSGTFQQGSVTFEGKEGIINLVTGSGFGGGPCPSEKVIIKINAGDLGFCSTKGVDETTILTMVNDGPSPKNFPSVKIQATIKNPAAQNKLLIEKILSTFKFLD